MPDEFDPVARGPTHSLTCRIDLVTLLIAAGIWAAVLALLSVLQAPMGGFVIVGGIFVVVAVAQVAFAPLGRPRTVSMLAGIVPTAVAEFLLRGPQSPLEFPGVIFAGAIYGYLAGVALAAAPLLASAVRRPFSASKRQSDEDAQSPWDDSE